MILEHKDKIIHDQNTKIVNLENKLNSSKSFILDTANFILPSSLDETIELKK